MKNFVLFNLLTVLIGFSSLRVVGQNHAKPSPQAPTDPSSRVVTGSILDSIKYYIKIVPHDTTLDEQMPTYKPDDFIAVDEQPVPIKQVSPKYPEIGGRRLGIEGTVWMKCLVGKDGKVSQAQVVRTDSDILVKPATAAALQWQFSPARLKGKPVSVWVAIPFRFRSQK